MYPYEGMILVHPTAHAEDPEGTEAAVKALFEKHGATLERLGVDVKNGFGDLLEKIAELPGAERDAIEADITACYDEGPPLAINSRDPEQD